ncbi:hypothetical protein HPB48_001640 [Haemaphysalis longicornis]|uniref:Retrotransposon gag domain-containing protein n=1 Tax=Haemaphysalis longicornis TaxID=44386 RepID=A0A9J6FZQ1_HAELO|nr:hypothetical protein HPB48_001640 [Haemaphysalis longicornis]
MPTGSKVPPPLEGSVSGRIRENHASLTELSRKTPRTGSSTTSESASITGGTLANSWNVVFSLDLTALVWYDNHEHRFDTWDSFLNKFRASFGDRLPERRRQSRLLRRELKFRVESCTTYIEEVLKLCSLVNPSMPDEDKVGHLHKGIAEDVYNYLITKENLASALDVIRHCRAFETLKMRRITPSLDAWQT